MKNKTLRLVFSAVCMALAILLPFLTGSIPQIGSYLCPMHLPILLCGFICGWKYGLIAGFLAPILRSLLFGMPPMLPTALAMAFELATYGISAGLLYRALPKKVPYLYIALVLSMLLGRAVWGVVSVCLYMAQGNAFTFAMFWASGFANAIPGIIAQIILIPPIVLALRKAHLMEEK